MMIEVVEESRIGCGFVFRCLNLKMWLFLVAFLSFTACDARGVILAMLDSPLAQECPSKFATSAMICFHENTDIVMHQR